jgi:type I restriction enzyme, S subunit
MANDNHDSHNADLPAGWVWMTIGEIAKQINSGFPSGQHNKESRGVPHLRPMNVSPKAEIDLSDLKYVEAKDYDPLLKGDVLFNNTNSPVWVGKTAYIKQDTNWAYSNHMTRIRLIDSGVSSAWVAYSLHYLFVTGYFRLHCRHHVNQASINTGFLSEVKIPLAPLPEQQRIVAKIEEQFTRLDAGVAALKRAQANLKRYKAAVLKAACEGRLVAQDASDEPASVLLERILARRGDPRGRPYVRANPGVRARASLAPTPPDVDRLPELPSGWCWATIDQLTRIVTKGSSPNWQGFDYQDAGIVFVSIWTFANFGALNLNN